MKLPTYLALIFFSIHFGTASAYGNTETVETTLIWNNDHSVILKIADLSITMRANQQRVVQLPHSEALNVQVETPNKTYRADEFLILDESGENTVQFYITNGSLRIRYDGELENVEDEPFTQSTTKESGSPGHNSSPGLSSGFSENKHDFLFTLVISERVSDESWTLDYSYRQMRLRNVAKTGNHDIKHGIVYNGGIRTSFLGGEIGFLTIPIDVGAGYGFTAGDFSTSATLNLAVAIFSSMKIYNDRLAEFMDDETNFEFFPSNAAFIRISNVWEPFQNRTGRLNQLGFSAKLNLGLSGGSNFTIGLSTDRIF